MNLAQASVEDQLAAFRRMVLRNPIAVTVLQRLDDLGLPDCYLTAGALFQTVWNCLTDRDPGAGIRDYDVFYFDADDLSWDAEDRAIRRAGEVFGDVEAVVEVRNEARVHLWYPDKFGVPCPPYRSTRDAIDSFAATACCLGVRPHGRSLDGRSLDGRSLDGGSLDGESLDVYAPHGFGDLFGLVLRPNPVLAPRTVYETKAARWQRQWPRLRVLPWPVGCDQPEPLDA